MSSILKKDKNNKKDMNEMNANINEVNRKLNMINNQIKKVKNICE